MTEVKAKTTAIHGVNLGGWLVLEKWMTPSLFAGTLTEDEYSLCEQLRSSEKLELITKHRESFITLKDFEWLKLHGITAVRLPIGYWAFGNEPPFLDTVNYTDKAFEWAEQTGIKVLLDIHGAPGSQNGHDHSGKSGKTNWPKDEQNIIKTLTALERLVEKYGQHPNLLGYELLNEPKKSIPRRILVPYYQAAYKLIRASCSEETWVVFSDGFKPARWKKVLRAPKYSNVFIDTHQYQVFDSKDKKLDTAGHLNKTLNVVTKDLQKMQKYHPTIVGEWSIALDEMSLMGLNEFEREDALRAYGATQLLTYEKTSVWFYWSYKTETGGVWSFQDCVNKELLPNLNPNINKS